MQPDLKTKLIYVAPRKVSTGGQPQPNALHSIPNQSDIGVDGVGIGGYQLLAI